MSSWVATVISLIRSGSSRFIANRLVICMRILNRSCTGCDSRQLCTLSMNLSPSCPWIETLSNTMSLGKRIRLDHYRTSVFCIDSGAVPGKLKSPQLERSLPPPIIWEPPPYFWGER